MSDVVQSTRSGARTVTAFFDTSDHAATAKADLIAVGIDETTITIVGSNADNFTVETDQHQGFWSALTNWFMPDDDRRLYAEGLRRGGFALSVQTDAARYKTVVDVLDRDGAVDLDDRQMTWRDEGWSPKDILGTSPIDAAYLPAGAGTAGFGASHAGEDGIARVDEATNPDVRERINAGTASQMAVAPTGGPQTYGNAATPADDRAADLAAGRDPDGLFARRDLDHGKVRVRSYIVEGDVNR
jgi:hypothetical protein